MAEFPIKHELTADEAYELAKNDAVEALVRFMEAADRIGRPQELMAAEIMGAFAVAAEQAQRETSGAS